MDLKTLKNKVWDLFGTVIAVILLLAAFGVLFTAGYSIYQFARHRVDGIDVKADENTDTTGLKLTPQYQVPLLVEGSEHWIIPVNLEKKDSTAPHHREKFSSDDYSSSSSYSYYSFFWGPCYNLVFINKKTGDAKLLLDQKAYIEHIYLPRPPYEPADKTQKPGFLILSIATVDTNQDGKINAKDATPGYIVNLDGSKLTQVTPDNTQMSQWRYDPESKTLFVEALENLNGDKVFNQDDVTTTLSINTLDPKMGHEVVPDSIKEKVTSILK